MNVIIMEESFIRCSSLRGELQSSGDQYHRDGSGLQVRTWQLWNVCLKPLGVLSSVCVCVLASEMSIREDCPGQCSSQRATSGTLCFVLWSSTWILTGRRRCCWEHMARSQLLFTDAPSNLLTLLIIKAVITLDEEDGDSLLCILVCRNFFVTNSNQWRMTTMGSLSYSGGGASRVQCCLLYTWI